MPKVPGSLWSVSLWSPPGGHGADRHCPQGLRTTGCISSLCPNSHHGPGPWHSLGPLTVTLSSPLPAPLVNTLKSATSLTRTPLGCRPRPEARQALGLQAGREKRGDAGGAERPYTEPQPSPLIPHLAVHSPPDSPQAQAMASCNPPPCSLVPPTQLGLPRAMLGRELATVPPAPLIRLLTRNPSHRAPRSQCRLGQRQGRA